MRPERGDVVRSSDPFKLGADSQRPWLIINNESHPFDEQQYIAVAVSTKEYDDSLALTTDVWEVGGVPQSSFVSPWAVHSPRLEDLVAWQGRVSEEFVDSVVAELTDFFGKRNVARNTTGRKSTSRHSGSERDHIQKKAE